MLGVHWKEKVFWKLANKQKISTKISKNKIVPTTTLEPGHLLASGHLYVLNITKEDEDKLRNVLILKHSRKTPANIAPTNLL